jgi:hypothetical protein
VREGVVAVVVDELDNGGEAQRLHEAILAVPVEDLDQLVAPTLPGIQTHVLAVTTWMVIRRDDIYCDRE